MYTPKDSVYVVNCYDKGFLSKGKDCVALLGHVK